MAKYDIGTLIYRILGDDSGIKKSLSDTEKNAKKTSVSFKRIIAGIGVAAIGSKLVSFFKDATDKASALQESTQKFGVVFSEVFPAASLAARDLAENYGLSERAAKDALSANANLFTQLGATQEQALLYGNTLAEVGTDLASFTNFSGGAEGAINALKSAVLGEREALKSLDIPILEEDLKEFANTLGKNYNAMTKLERATLSLDLIIKRADNAIGDFARSADSWANVQRRLDAAIEDTSARIGSELLPGLSKLGIALIDSNKSGSVFAQGLKGLATAINSIIEIGADWINHQTIQANRLRENFDETYRLEKQIERTKKQMADYGIELAKNAGQAGTAAEGAKALKTALKNGDFDARRFSDAVRDLSVDLETLRIQSISITDPLGRTATALATSFKIARTEATKYRGQVDTTAKAQKLAFDKEMARRQAEIDLARFAGDEEEAIRLEGLKSAAEVGNNKLLGIKQKADLSTAYQKQAEDDITAYKIQKANEYASTALNYATNLFSALSALSQAQTENRLNDIDLQLQRALEVAGVEEDTAIEKAEKELEIAKEDGDAKEILEKENAVKRAEIEAEYDKKRRKAEYEGALAAWNYQLAAAIAQVPVAVLNAIASGWAAGPIMGPILAGSYGAAAGLAGGIQVAAVAASKPQPPKFEGGGIIPGSSSGTTVIAGENNKAEGIFNQSQMQRLLDIADGNTGFTQVAPMSKQLLLDDLFEASQNGTLLIADNAIVGT